MSYFNQAQDPRRRNAAIVAVVAIHAVIGYGLVTGLTFTKLVEEFKNPGGVLIPDVPLPPPPEPEPTTQVDPAYDPPVAPVPPIPLPPLPGPTYQEYDDTLPVLPEVPRGTETGPVVQPDPPRPTPTFTPRKAKPSNDPSRWVTEPDYPSGPLRAEIEGVTGYRVMVSTAGRVSSCEVTRSSGNGALDEATCKFITRRARFDPATDETGASVIGSYTGSVRWDIPD